MSHRNKNDGASYFGSKKTLSGKVVNDFVIKSRDRESDNRHKGRHFRIKYSPENGDYWVKDFGIGPGVYVRLDWIYQIQNNSLFHIGDSYLVVNIENELIHITMFGGVKSGVVFTASQGHFIRIGRNGICDILIDDKLLSKIQVSIFYEMGKGWWIVDGDLNRGKASTNGTWLYLNTETKL